MILNFIVLSSYIQFNLTNFSINMFRLSFEPFIDTFGSFFFAIFFGFIGAGMYANERSIGTITTYLILVGAFMGFVMPNAVVAIFGLLLAFALSVIFYRTFIEPKM